MRVIHKIIFIRLDQRLPILSCKSSISLFIDYIFFFFCSISSWMSSSLGSFLPLPFSSLPFLLESSRISSLSELIYLIRSTFSFMMRIFSCLWMSASFCRFFFNMAMDFSKYFFWFLYSCSIYESIFTWVMLSKQTTRACQQLIS